MTDPLVQTRPDHNPEHKNAPDQPSKHGISRHRAESPKTPFSLSRFSSGLGGNGYRLALVASACAVLIGVGAAGQASEPATPAAAPTAQAPTTANAESRIDFEKSLVKAEAAPSQAPVEPQAAPAPPPAPAPAPAPEPAPVAVDDPAAAQTYAASQLGAHGWAADQMQCLTTLWTKESDWKTTATNPSSGAYGIVQSLPAEKMASAGADYVTNFRTQINWGLDYIKERYGSPCGALNFHYANNWY
ncbi:hypothetical protein [Arthrobacter sp.]|uniref:aggregation-promoting factor C-terminal-like domain-containing protein n=1 Tax=Arthrobacter sp. TaxID=1667 RepID=UPI002810B917|nr:hypothetical protein [Arthrobacter sp.]